MANFSARWNSRPRIRITHRRFLRAPRRLSNLAKKNGETTNEPNDSNKTERSRRLDANRKVLHDCPRSVHRLFESFDLFVVCTLLGSGHRLGWVIRAIRGPLKFVI